MNAMRLMARLAIAQEKFEGDVARIIGNEQGVSLAVAERIKAGFRAKRGPYKKKRTALHWTQRPENSAKMRRNVKAAQKARRLENA